MSTECEEAVKNNAPSSAFVTNNAENEQNITKTWRKQVQI